MRYASARVSLPLGGWATDRYPIPLGVYTTSSAGRGDLTVIFGAPASAAAWGRPQ